ncbi:SDR family oxidoreductase [Priestia koreensis]|uniref:SDR family oxidoreductase n=1 Tax=Priestia koreensis TaxID=284581 RepID=UPI001F55E2BE|nr:SDR family oxidoreductase [Priestia koreensis]UNL82998.1 SDR family oxidoreductase [Priestia koreensis]
MKILVAGANGKTGKLIVEELQKHTEYNPKAMIRKSEQRSYFEAREVETVVADLEESITHAFEDVDAVIFAAAAGSGGHDVNAIDHLGVIKAVDEAKAKGIERFILISSRYADRPAEGPPFLKPYLEAKEKSDAYLEKSGLDYTIIRPGGLLDSEGTEHIQAAFRVKGEVGMIPRADVAKVAVACLKEQGTIGKAFELVSGEDGIYDALKSV